MKTANKREFFIHIVDEIVSTNNFIKQNVEELYEGYTIRAIKQISGRGRFSRKWISQNRLDLTFSTLVFIPSSSSIVINVPQIVGYSISTVLEKYQITSKIKWPNDILVNNKKISGILVEGVVTNKYHKLIIGIGLNINSDNFNDIDIEATSIKNEIGRTVDINEVMEKLLKEIYNNIAILETQGFVSFKDKIEKQLAYRNEIKVIKDGDRTIIGEIISISDSGTLLVKVGDEIQELISGEISFKKATP